MKKAIFYCLLLAIVGVLSYRIYTLEKEKKALRISEVRADEKILNITRSYEWQKSSISIDLLDCRGVKRETLDSIIIRLYFTNEILRKRDSTYVAEKLAEIEK